MFEPISETKNIKSTEFMRFFPDKYFDLSIVDPTYEFLANGKQRNNLLLDDVQSYFDELFRVSKEQIIWGGNNFQLPPCKCFICWDKKLSWSNVPQCEFAWTSFDKPPKLISVNGRVQNKISPNQKPIELYKRLIEIFVNDGDVILGTPLCGGSCRIAAYQTGHNFYGCESDKDIYEKQEIRFRKVCLGEYITKDGHIWKQQTLF